MVSKNDELLNNLTLPGIRSSGEQQWNVPCFLLRLW